MPLNSLIIGLGKIGLLYDLNKKILLTHSKCLNHNRRYNLLGGIDLNKKNLSKFKKKFQKQIWSNIKNYDLKKKVDLVVLSSAAEDRYNDIKKIIKYINPKNILEKPASNDLNTLNSIINITKKQNKHIYKLSKK